MATIVLVHGTTAGGWVWRDAITKLRAAGHEVYAPTLTGLGERVHLLTRGVGLDTHISDVVNLLRFEELQDVILAGHSYGGMVITGVADQVPERIAHLVFLDALVPENGESLLDLMSADRRRDAEQNVQAQGEGWMVPVSSGSTDRPGRNTPHPYKSWADPIKLAHAARGNIPCTYVRFSADKQPNANFQQAMATSWQRVQGGGWRIYEVDTVHQIMADPAPKSEILLRLLDDFGKSETE